MGSKIGTEKSCSWQLVEQCSTSNQKWAHPNINGSQNTEIEHRFMMSGSSGGLNRRQLIKQLSWILGGGLTGFFNISSVLALESANAPKPSSPQLALIIDDIGHSRSLANQFVALKATLTFSVLPHLAYSRQLGKELHYQGYEVMLHQPMEPLDNCCDPGPGAVFVGDNALKIETTIQSNIRAVPFATGVNNHMGSRFTASSYEIATALKVIRSRKLFFIDSITSNRSLAHATARQYRIPTAYRNVFLDNVRKESAILARLNQLHMHAIRHGRAIGIGHPFPETARAIGRFAKQMKRSRVQLVPASHIL